MTRKRLSIASGVLLVTFLLARRRMGRGPTEAEDQIHALSASGETVAAKRLSVTRQLREQAALALELAQSRYNLGLGSIVEFSQAELQKSEADIADADAKYQYRLTQIVLAYTISSPK